MRALCVSHVETSPVAAGNQTLRRFSRFSIP
jgi:hypothetical protein